MRQTFEIIGEIYDMHRDKYDKDIEVDEERKRELVEELREVLDEKKKAEGN